MAKLEGNIKENYEIEYTTVGNKTDKVCIWARKPSDAIAEFIEMEWDLGNGFKNQYTEYAIKNIRTF